MNFDLVIQLAVTLALGACMLLVGIVLLRFIALGLVKSWLKPYIFKAILAGEMLALDAFKQADLLISGWDKQAIANSIYHTLPDVIWILILPIPVGTIRLFVTTEMFAKWVEQEFMQANAFIKKNGEFLVAQVEALKTMYDDEEDGEESI